MDKFKLKGLSVEDLKKKEKSHKTLIGVFIPLILALAFFAIREYVKEDNFDWASTTILICTIGGAASIYPELKAVQEELTRRN